MQNLNVLSQPYQRMMENHLTRLADELSDGRGIYNTRSDWLCRREEVRAGLIRALGGFPEEPCPLNPEITGRVERDGYVIEKLLYQSRPGFYVTAAVYVPSNARFPTPAILCPHGHWQNGRYNPEVQSRMIGLARRGYIALSLDKVGYNQREPEGPHRSRNLFLVGMTVQGIQVWDNMRAIDYLYTRDDVCSVSLRAAGSPLCGIVALIAAATDGRIAEVQIDKLLLSYRLQEDFGGNADLVIPGVLKCADVADIASMIAPRALEIGEFIAADGRSPSTSEIAAAFKRCMDVYNLLKANNSVKLP